MQLKKAARKQVKLRIGISGASGFGKTTSALLLAYGMTGDWDKIAIIDTENESASLYANKVLSNGFKIGEFNAINLAPPFEPERFAQAIKTCEEAGMEVVIIDSASAEWEGKGGMLEIVEKLGGRYQDWAKANPRHQKFQEGILQSKAHTITCTRRKQDYEMTKNDRGGLVVQKAGMKEITRDGWEYELTLNFELINDKHLAKASKDRTGLYMDAAETIITPETGKILMAWANEGEYKNPDLELIKVTIQDSCFTQEEKDKTAAFLAKSPDATKMEAMLTHLKKLKDERSAVATVSNDKANDALKATLEAAKK